MNRCPLSWLAAGGLAVGGVFGLLGSFTSSDSLRGLAWGLDGAGLVMASAVLCLLFHRWRRDLAAAGFLVFLAGQTLVVSGAPMSLEASVPSFGTGALLWSVALVLISSDRFWPPVVRALGFLAAVLFAVTALQILAGRQILPTSAPLPFYAYPIFVSTMAGWIYGLVRARET